MTKWRMDTTPDMINLENQLLGRVYNTKTRKWEDDENSVKLCNKRGVSAAKLYLAALSKSSIQANLTEVQFYNVMDTMIDDLTLDFGLNYHEYGIQRVDREKVLRIIARIIFLVLSRSIGDKERDYSVRQGRETFVQRYITDPLRNAAKQISL